MDSCLLTVNAGSTTIKFALWGVRNSQMPATAAFRGLIEDAHDGLRFHVEEQSEELPLARESLEKISADCASGSDKQSLLLLCLNELLSPDQISLVCHRIVHGGDRYTTSVAVDSSVIENLETLSAMAPLHQPQNIRLLKALLAELPDARHIVCFDTAFHRTMPEQAQHFAIPAELRNNGIKRYGFHGLSYQYIAAEIERQPSTHSYRKVIALHLGSGASACAMLNGGSIATSMSFSPLDGLPMATRSGAIDAGAVLYMASALKMSVDEISRVLNKESGLLGLSGLSGDIRQLLPSDSSQAQFALDYFVYHVALEVGTMASALQGVDALVFTGGIGFHNWQIRQMVCENLAWLNLQIDQEKNQANEMLLHSGHSKVGILAIRTDEERMMARNALALAPFK